MAARSGAVQPRRRAASRLACFAVLGALALSSGAAFAASPKVPEPSGAEAQALALYRKSTAAYEEGRFQDAVDLLNQAYALKREPVISFNLARAYEGLGDPASAVAAYRRYLEEDPAASDRKSVEQRIVTLQRQLDERAALEVQRDAERERAERERRKAREERERREAADRARGPIVLPWVLVGAGVLGIGAGALFGVLSRNKAQDAADEPYRAPALEKNATAKSYATAANVAFVVGGATAVAGGVWAFVALTGSRAPKTAPRAAVSIGPAEIAFRATF